jgi:hypothetical protein
MWGESPTHENIHNEPVVDQMGTMLENIVAFIHDVTIAIRRQGWVESP